MRALVLALVALALAGCPSTANNCPVDTISSASQCIPIDMAAPTVHDLSIPRDLTPAGD